MNECLFNGLMNRSVELKEEITTIVCRATIVFRHEMTKIERCLFHSIVKQTD